MSYILEAIKRAESERGNKRLSQAVIDEALDRTQEKKGLPWVAIAIFINALILLAWIGYQIFFDTKNPEANVSLSTSLESEDDKSKDVKNSIQLQPSDDNDNMQHMPSVDERKQMEKKQHALAISIDEQSKQAVANSGTANDLSDSVRAALDELEDQDIPVFFSVKKQPIESTEETQNDDNKVGSLDIESPKPFADAKIEPVQKIVNEQEIANVDPIEEKGQVYRDTIEDTRVIPIIKHTDVPSYEELPYSMQEQIPKLAISVHIYNADESARKVRINGQLLYEGEQIDNQTTIEEITPRGLIINFASKA